jgi:hypothetical protein
VSSFLKITRIPYEEPYHLNLVVRASSGSQTGELEIYTTPEALLEGADALSEFPRHSTDVFLWELGSERPEDLWAFYFRFRVFLTKPTGECPSIYALTTTRISRAEASRSFASRQSRPRSIGWASYSGSSRPSSTKSSPGVSLRANSSRAVPRLPPNKPLQLTAAGLRCAEALLDTYLGSITRGRS